jgi:hypothetical protein
VSLPVHIRIGSTIKKVSTNKFGGFKALLSLNPEGLTQFGEVVIMCREYTERRQFSVGKDFG